MSNMKTNKKTLILTSIVILLPILIGILQHLSELKSSYSFSYLTFDPSSLKFVIQNIQVSINSFFHAGNMSTLPISVLSQACQLKQ